MRYSQGILLLAIAVATPANATNVLVNAGFETGALAPWSAVGSGAVTNAQAHTGAYSLAAFSADGARQDFAAVATSQITEVSFWALRDGGPFDAYTFFYDDSTNQQFVANRIGSSGWQFFDVTANLAANKNLIGFRIFGTSPGPAYLDDFTINAAGGVPEPATWAMMLGGFGLLGAATRRRLRANVTYA